MMKFGDKKFIAGKIKYYRKKAKLTQTELAELVNLSDQHISRIESGIYIPSLSSFFTIASVLKMDLTDFGYNCEPINDSRKDKIIDIVKSAEEKELILYEKIIEAINSAL